MGSLPTKNQYTGQISHETELGLYFYKARFYDSSIMQFNQPDTLIIDPLNVLDWNRYAYARYNPVRYRDPSGHWIESALDASFIGYDIYDISQNGLNWENGLSLVADVAGLILPAVTGGGVLVRAAMHADDVGDVARVSNKALSLSDNAVAFGKKLVENVDEQVHHLASDKNAKWTPILKNLAQKYGDLNGNCNKVKVPQNSNHPEQYHRWIADALSQIDLVAQGDPMKFQELCEMYVTKTVKENPWLLKNVWWDKYGEEFWKWWETMVTEGL